VSSVLALQVDAAVVEFGADDGLGDRVAVGVAELLLAAGEVSAALGDRAGASVAVAAPGEVGDRDVAFEAGAEGGGGDFRSAKDKDLVEVGELGGVEGLFAVLDL
jgi:hypothetical protein